MRFSYAAVAALVVAVANSQSIASLVGQIPSCAVTCLATAATAAHCGLADYTCQCGPAKDAISKSATPCVLSSCTGNDPIKVLTISNEICAIVASGLSSITTIAPPVPSIPPIYGPTPTTAAPASTTSGPLHVTANAAPRVQAGAAIAGAAMLAVFAL